jgi:hypothetical protein
LSTPVIAPSASDQSRVGTATREDFHLQAANQNMVAEQFSNAPSTESSHSDQEYSGKDCPDSLDAGEIALYEAVSPCSSLSAFHDSTDLPWREPLREKPCDCRRFPCICN